MKVDLYSRKIKIDIDEFSLPETEAPVNALIAQGFRCEVEFTPHVHIQYDEGVEINRGQLLAVARALDVDVIAEEA